MPFAVRWPGHIKAGSVTDEVQQMTDLFPTLLAASGATDLPSDLDGRDLLSALDCGYTFSATHVVLGVAKRRARTNWRRCGATRSW